MEVREDIITIDVNGHNVIFDNDKEILDKIRGKILHYDGNHVYFNDKGKKIRVSAVILNAESRKRITYKDGLGLDLRKSMMSVNSKKNISVGI